eukprot:5702678-Amphidinium_carterae.2
MLGGQGWDQKWVARWLCRSVSMDILAIDWDSEGVEKKQCEAQGLDSEWSASACVQTLTDAEANVPRASVADSDLCKTKVAPCSGSSCGTCDAVCGHEMNEVLVMHKPTHEKWREDDYPYAWHLHGKKRTWEAMRAVHI